MPKGKVYTEADKQKALGELILNRGNLTLTARQLRMPKKTLEYWRDTDAPEYDVYRREKLKCFIDKAFDKIDEMFAELVPEKMREAKLKDLAISIAALADKIGVFQKISGEKSEHKPDPVEKMTDEELDKQIQQAESSDTSIGKMVN